MYNYLIYEKYSRKLGELCVFIISSHLYFL